MPGGPHPARALPESAPPSGREGATTLPAASITALRTLCGPAPCRAAFGRTSLPPLAKRVAGGPTQGAPGAGVGVLPRGASSTVRRGCRWVPWPTRRIILVALSPRPAIPPPYPSPPLGFAERGEGRCEQPTWVNRAACSGEGSRALPRLLTLPG